MWPNPQVTSDLVTYTEKFLNRKIQFCAVKTLTRNRQLFLQNNFIIDIWQGPKYHSAVLFNMLINMLTVVFESLK